VLVDSNTSALALDYTLNEVLSNASILVPSVKIKVFNRSSRFICLKNITLTMG